jgi:asparagine synthase (glutamine-hydrolysing)
MSNYLLSSQGDRMAMGNSVEIRVPYLDHRIIEYAARIPSRWKLRGLQEKYILKKSFSSLLPKRIVFRNKQPYRAPIKESIFDSVKGNVFEMLSPESINKYKIFDAAKTEKLLNKFERNKNIGEFDSMALAGIFSTQVIMRTFIDNPVEKRADTMAENFIR